MAIPLSLCSWRSGHMDKWSCCPFTSRHRSDSIGAQALAFHYFGRYTTKDNSQQDLDKVQDERNLASAFPAPAIEGFEALAGLEISCRDIYQPSVFMSKLPDVLTIPLL